MFGFSLCYPVSLLPLQFWSSSATRSLSSGSLTVSATGPWPLRSGTAHQVLEIAAVLSNSLSQRMAASWAYLNGINAIAPAVLSLGVDKELDWWKSPVVWQSGGHPALLSSVGGERAVSRRVREHERATHWDDWHCGSL